MICFSWSKSSSFWGLSPKLEVRWRGGEGEERTPPTHTHAHKKKSWTLKHVCVQVLYSVFFFLWEGYKIKQVTCLFFLNDWNALVDNVLWNWRHTTEKMDTPVASVARITVFVQFQNPHDHFERLALNGLQMVHNATLRHKLGTEHGYNEKLVTYLFLYKAHKSSSSSFRTTIKILWIVWSFSCVPFLLLKHLSIGKVLFLFTLDLLFNV